VKDNYPSVKTSAEVEIKPSKISIADAKKFIYRLIGLTNYLFLSKDLILQITPKESCDKDDKFIDAKKLINHFINDCNKMSANHGIKCNLIVPWGDKGAYGYFQGKIIHTKAHSPQNGVKDTIGAGDTFIGAFLYGLSKKFKLDQCLQLANKVAGFKVGFHGFDCIKTLKC